MGVNDTPLSQRERDELRQTVTAGATRMRRVRARRIQALSGAAAVVLVGGVVTAVVLGTTMPADSPITTTSPTPSASPTPTPSATPSATPTSTSAPVTARSLFDGDCGAMIGSDSVSEAFGVAMQVLPLRWQSPRDALAGGVECVWWDGESYMTPSLTVYAYPAPPEARESALACTTESYASLCHTSFVVNGAWVDASATGAGLTQDGMQRLVDTARRSIAAGSPPRMAERAEGWWTLPSCDELSAVAQPEGAMGSAQPPSATTLAESDSVRETVARAAAPYDTTCVWKVDLSGTEDSGPPYSASASVEVIPGGGPYFDQIATSEGAEPIQIPGVPQAVLVTDNARWEGYAPALAVRDGVNMIVFRSDNGLERSRLAPLAAPYLAYLDAQLP